MIKKVNYIVLAAFCCTANAGGLLDDLNSIKARESTYRANQQAKLDKVRRQAALKAENERRQRLEIKAREDARVRIAAEKAKANARVAAARAKTKARLEHEQAMRAKNRDLTYEDELRKMEIEEKKMALRAKQARLARVDEFIDQDLNRRKAETDVVQSTADAKRNISQGTKDMFTGLGKGAEAQGKKWW